jgi:hypothetical protein
MSIDKTYSRDYLQTFRERSKNELSDIIITRCVNSILKDSVEGKTTYLYEITASPDLCGFFSYISPSQLTTDDYLAAFHRKFPDCTISYQETWEPNTRILKKGILVDWS